MLTKITKMCGRMIQINICLDDETSIGYIGGAILPKKKQISVMSSISVWFSTYLQLLFLELDHLVLYLAVLM
jgi:hypothetical protein